MVEFRLYYNDNGECLCYTCENLEGNYLVVDRQTFAEGRPDVKVINGKLIKPSNIINIVKLVMSDNGTACAEEDISIVVDKDYIGPVLTWEEKLHESRHY